MLPAVKNKNKTKQFNKYTSGKSKYYTWEEMMEAEE